jgi:hypothetical protein
MLMRLLIGVDINDLKFTLHTIYVDVKWANIQGFQAEGIPSVLHKGNVPAPTISHIQA